MNYVKSYRNPQRFETRKVKIGTCEFGGDNPIRVQSMTTENTMDTEASVEQSIRMIEAGCELVRITAPSKKDAENLKNIKAELEKRGYNTPLVADIHFTPNAAMVAADYVEKIRVNPGNYADKKRFEEIEYTDESYQAELERIREKFTPLVLKCKELGRAMRIGTNHGSLSDRILSRYGDSPMGMVMSAMEFIDICVDNDYYDLVLSMKASNALVMVQAYRLLVKTMKERGYNFPLHLGVTEAGDGEDGRVKSAVGIGTLLLEGLGDTVRVSLTEEPEAEMPVARSLIDLCSAQGNDNTTDDSDFQKHNPYQYMRYKTNSVGKIGGDNEPRVFVSLNEKCESPASLFNLGYRYAADLDKWNIGDMACDFIAPKEKLNFAIPGTLQQVGEDLLIYALNDKLPDTPHLLQVSVNDDVTKLKEKLSDNSIILLQYKVEDNYGDFKHFLLSLKEQEVVQPLVLKAEARGDNKEAEVLYLSAVLGSALIDGFGDAIWLDAKHLNHVECNRLAFGILQATRTRISKTEYISCPSCGRTLFDLQDTTAKIRSVTNHLKGVKIGIMGCIVNGPGEMADADFGYVGTGPGLVSLYKEKEVVKRNVPEAQAVDALIDLIKEHGKWVEVE